MLIHIIAVSDHTTTTTTTTPTTPTTTATTTTAVAVNHSLGHDCDRSHANPHTLSHGLPCGHNLVTDTDIVSRPFHH